MGPSLTHIISAEFLCGFRPGPSVESSAIGETVFQNAAMARFVLLGRPTGDAEAAPRNDLDQSCPALPAAELPAMSAPGEPLRDIAHLGHVELLTPKPDESLWHFTDIIGMETMHREGRSAYLRGDGDDATTTLKLTEAAAPGVGHIAWRAANSAALERHAGVYLGRRPARKFLALCNAAGEQRVRRPTPRGTRSACRRPWPGRRRGRHWRPSPRCRRRRGWP